MSNWEYNTFQITKVTEEEHKLWTEEAFKRGYRTLSAFLRAVLVKFKPNKGETTRGEINISVSSYEGLEVRSKVSWGASPQVRKHINDFINKTTTKEKSNGKKKPL